MVAVLLSRLSARARSSRLQITIAAVLASQLAASQVSAQDVIPRLTRIDVQANIELDGRLDEAVWQQIPAFDGMRVVTPDTLAESSLRTETRIFYTERGIYVGVMNHQDTDTLVARMTPRDTRLERDGVVISIDASGDGLYGYMMRVNLGDSKTDGTILAERQFNMQWDGPWEAYTSVVEGGWVAEYFIPWSMIALPQASGGDRQIGIYMERQVGHLNETWSNPALPSTVNQFLSAFQKFELEDIEPRTQITYYPYVSGTYDGVDDEAEMRAGAEVFWRPSTNTQLSLSLNPDFGNVESDDVVVNLTAYETFFPEKRAFFLEGQDVFNTSPRNQSARGPGGPTSMLNTRRIGSSASFDVPAGVRVADTDLSAPTDLLGAVKFTGQSGNWRYGTLAAMEDDMEIRGTLNDGTRVTLESEGRDFTVGRLLYETTGPAGRRSIGWMGTDVSHSDIDATVNGVDVHYFSGNNRWLFDGQVLRSDVDGVEGNGATGDLIYMPQRGVMHRFAAGYHDDTLDLNTLGFLTRNDLSHFDYNYTNNSSNVEGLRSREYSLFVFNHWNGNNDWVRQGVFNSLNLTFLNNHSLNNSLRYYARRVEDRLGRGSGDYKIPGRWQFVSTWESDPSQQIRYKLGIDANTEDLGERNTTTTAGISYRPVDNFSLDVEASYTDREGLLVYQGGGRYTSFEATQWSPKVTLDYFISARQQFRVGLQWTGLKAFENKFLQVNPDRVEELREVPKPDAESDNFVISRLTFQARYRWEIAPLSDLFVVYTRGGNVPGGLFDEYTGLLSESWQDPVVDTLVVKLRYRLGS
ncbi:DUF5916 domain-containing protein [Pseudohongiella sp. SYSU M77423]|uniref:DUF5916 domain-containing protein n=1 Tax=Pseudohongiella sp. SYSU M77423 TaxID=3042312 RepID=UPI0024811FC8|nr:DUF5916 domain-containing protein [Pseudohongiella sp. SYSU M77423]MDH7943333.1 DUF5916 domain-containing protein [Pseudohongiella sp. SYSU M77423]